MILNILHFPDLRLRTRAVPVTLFDEDLKRIIKDMFETMYEAPGIGLAATQVNIHQRILVIDVSEDKDQPLCLINPEIMTLQGEEEMEEGCLSVPGIYEKVTRAETVSVRAMDESGNSFDMDADGLLAICIQHEVDHLDGRLFVDHLTRLKQQRIRKKLEKEHKRGLHVDLASHAQL